MAAEKVKNVKTTHLCERRFEVRSLKNVDGKGKTRKYVHLQQYEAKNEKQVLESMRNGNTFTRGTAEDVLSALRDFFVEEMRYGRRVYIPGIGYFSLTAGVKEPITGAPGDVTGDDVRITGINFRPESNLLHDIGKKMHFVWADYGKSSLPYQGPDEVLKRVKEFLETNDSVTVSSFSVFAGLTKHATRRYLKYFCEKGIMVKVGSDRSPVYMLK